MPNVSKTSTMYFTSLKKRLAQASNIPIAEVKKISSIRRAGTQSKFMLNPILEKDSITARTAEATAKSKRLAKTDARGNISRGKYIFVTRLLLLVRLVVAKRIDPIKNAQGSALTETEAI